MTKDEGRDYLAPFQGAGGLALAVQGWRPEAQPLAIVCDPFGVQADTTITAI